MKTDVFKWLNLLATMIVGLAVFGLWSEVDRRVMTALKEYTSKAEFDAFRQERREVLNNEVARIYLQIGELKQMHSQNNNKTDDQTKRLSELSAKLDVVINDLSYLKKQRPAP